MLEKVKRTSNRLADSVEVQTNVIECYMETKLKIKIVYMKMNIIQKKMMYHLLKMIYLQ